jgi:cob(I)alamin adenosyltransferase
MPGRRRDEPVRLTRIYTRTGDAGETTLGDLSRVRKTHPRVQAYGAVDEANSWLGLVLAAGPPDDVRRALERIQNELFDLGADLSVPYAEGDGKLRVTQAQIDELERLCDAFNEPLPTLKSFVLPGGTELAARLHVARAVARRAEIAALAAAEAEPGWVNPLVTAYLNRLSDLLFILARTANRKARGGKGGMDEPLWKPGSSR